MGIESTKISIRIIDVIHQTSLVLFIYWKIKLWRCTSVWIICLVELLNKCHKIEISWEFLNTSYHVLKHYIEYWSRIIDYCMFSCNSLILMEVMTAAFLNNLNQTEDRLIRFLYFLLPPYCKVNISIKYLKICCILRPSQLNLFFKN